MAKTTNIGLHVLVEGQANKEASITEAHEQLDALVQASVKDRDLNTPPNPASNGDRYLIATGATGEWSGQDGNIAHYRNGAWVFIPPKEGWRLYIDDEDVILVYDGSSWQTLGSSVAIEVNGSSILDSASVLDFTGMGVTVSDGGGGKAAINIPVGSGGSAVAGLGGIWEQIDRIEFSAMSNVSIGGSQVPANYDAYMLLVADTSIDTDGEKINLYASTDGGTTRLANYAEAGTFRRSSNSGGNFGSNMASELFNSPDMDTGTPNKNYNALAVIINPSGTNHKSGIAFFQSTEDFGSNPLFGQYHHFFIETTSSVDAFVLETSGGARISGTVVLLGLKKSETAGRVVAEAGTARTLGAEDNNRILHFTNAGTGVAVTVPDTLPEGFACRLVNETGGAMSIAAGGTLTILGDTSLAQNRPAEVSVVTGTRASVVSL